MVWHVNISRRHSQQLPDLAREGRDHLGVAQRHLRHERHELAKLLGILGRLELENLNVRLVMPELLHTGSTKTDDLRRRRTRDGQGETQREMKRG